MASETDYGIDMRKCVYVEGISTSDTDEQITEFCSTFGPVNKVLRVRQTGQTSGVKALVEFQSVKTVTDLAPTLPQVYPSFENSFILWRVDVAYKTSHSPKKIKPLDLTTFPENEEFSLESDTDSDDSRTPLIPRTHTKLDPTDVWTKVTHAKNPKEQKAPYSDIINPTEVQKIIVEHVIKNDGFNAPSQSSKWLRPFSGKVPKPPNEVDFETWCLHVELMIQDHPSVDIQRRKILLIEATWSPGSPQ